jgi:hypothetical protein
VGDGDDHDRQHVCARAVARERRARRCCHRARARDRRQDATRTRLYRGDRGLLRTLRRAAAGSSHALACRCVRGLGRPLQQRR